MTGADKLYHAGLDIQPVNLASSTNETIEVHVVNVILEEYRHKKDDSDWRENIEHNM